MGDWFTVEKIDTQTFAISEYQHYGENALLSALRSERGGAD